MVTFYQSLLRLSNKKRWYRGYGRSEKCVADKPDWMREFGRSRGKWNTDTKMVLIQGVRKRLNLFFYFFFLGAQCVESGVRCTDWIFEKGTIFFGHPVYRSFPTRVSQLKIWRFWVIDTERNVCRCTFSWYSVITQFAQLAAGEQLCHRWTYRKL